MMKDELNKGNKDSDVKENKEHKQQQPLQQPQPPPPPSDHQSPQVGESDENKASNVDEHIQPALQIAVSNSTRQPFTSLSQEEADNALARALQQQERIYMYLRTNNEDSEFDSSGSGSYDYGIHINAGDDSDEGNDDDDDGDEDEGGEEFLVGQDLDEASENWERIDGSQFENDEAFARALQEAEDRETTAQMMALAGIHDLDEEDDGDSDGSQEMWQDVDPDNMSYEELVALGEAVGTQSRGLSSDVIAALPTSVFSEASGAGTSDSEQCVICRHEYEKGDPLLTLPCQHNYHSECIQQWLRINKVCPVCSAEVSGSSS